MKYEEYVKEPTKPAFIPYIVRIDNDTLQVRQEAGNSYKTIGQVHRNELYTIVNEKNGWGQRKKGGWICLDYVKKV